MPDLKVLLIAMPWNRSDYPSIQIGMLKAILNENNIQCEAYYPYLNLNHSIGSELYFKVSNNLHPILSESFFCNVYNKRLSEEFVSDCILTGELSYEEVKQVYHKCNDFINQLAADVKWIEYTHVGFTCTFNQIWSSLALAKIINRINPDIKIVFGGKNFSNESSAWFIDNFKFINAIFIGPGENTFLNYLKLDDSNGQIIQSRNDIDQNITLPDYSEYLSSAYLDKDSVNLVLAGSSGCDYGKCTFCVLNSEDTYILYRKNELLNHIETLNNRYQFHSIEFSDTSLSKYLYDDASIIKLKEMNLVLYGEMRAVLNEKKASNLRMAGFRGLQIGIESFSSNVLRLMKKPADLITNIYNLRLCYENEIECAYNIILDYPGTKRQDIIEMMDFIPKIFHLTPPAALLNFSLMFNSYVYRNPHKFNIVNIRPSKYYYHFGNTSFNRSYPYQYYDYDTENEDLATLYKAFNELCFKWLDVYDATLSLLRIEAFYKKYLIVDERGEKKEEILINEADYQCILYCSIPRNLKDAYFKFDQKIINKLIEKDILIIDSNKIVSLIVTNKKRNMSKAESIESYFS